MNISHLEKTADNIGALLGKTVLRAGRIVKENPLKTLGLVAAVGAGGTILNWANRARGLHQIINEAGKRDVMDYQSRLLREIALNTQGPNGPLQTQGSPAMPGFKQPMPIVPPLR